MARTKTNTQNRTKKTQNTKMQQTFRINHFLCFSVLVKVSPVLNVGIVHQEEALKVEMAMQKLAVEQVKQERAEGEQRLQKAVKETELRSKT